MRPPDPRDDEHDDRNDGARFSCRDSTWLVSEARDRPLSATERAQLHRHIDSCPHCQVASKQFERLFAQIDDLLGHTRHNGG
jgi:hypothetical protein